MGWLDSILKNRMFPFTETNNYLMCITKDTSSERDHLAFENCVILRFMLSSAGASLNFLKGGGGHINVPFFNLQYRTVSYIPVFKMFI